MTLGAKKQSFKDAPLHVQRTVLKIMGGFACIGLLILIGVGVWYWNHQRFIQASNPTTAEVLKVDENIDQSDGKTTRTYSVTFRFTDANGQTHTVTPWYSSSDWSFRKGRMIDIRYRRSNPEDAVPWGYSDRLFGLPLLLAIPFIIGVTFALLGTAGFLGGYRTYRLAKTQASSNAEGD